MVYPQIEICMQKLLNNVSVIPEDDPIREVMAIYASEVDIMIDREHRRHLGLINSSGNKLVQPLTEYTTPPLTEDLISIANNLLIGKYRLEVNNNNKLWDEAWGNFLKHLVDTYGWPSSDPFFVITIITPNKYLGEPGDTVTIAGVNFLRFDKLTFRFDGIDISPETDIITDSAGAFAEANITIPDKALKGGHIIRVEDGKVDNNGIEHKNFAEERFLVTASPPTETD